MKGKKKKQIQYLEKEKSFVILDKDSYLKSIENTFERFFKIQEHSFSSW